MNKNRILIKFNSDGYKRLLNDFKYKRIFSLKNNELIITDSLNFRYNKKYTIRNYLHWNHDIKFNQIDDSIFEVYGNSFKGILTMKLTNNNNIKLIYGGNGFLGYQSNSYGQTIASNTFLIENKIDKPCNLSFCLTWK